MNLFFFQNCISPHQLPYIKELHKMEGVEKVVYVAPIVSDSHRSQMGWQSILPSEEGVSFMINPSVSEIETLLINNTDTHLFFSGITAFTEVFSWFKLSLRYPVHRHIITEPPFVYDKPLWMHACKFILKDWRYTKHIDNIFLMGEDYRRYYEHLAKTCKVIPFAYCTAWRERKKEASTDEHLRLLFVGSLCRRKNVKLLLESIALIDETNRNKVELGVVGDGGERELLSAYACNHNLNVTFFGSQPIERIPEFMEGNDVLVLHDGWGAVVNEALTLGLYVICSDACGAKDLLKDPRCGSVYKSGDSDDLKTKIVKCAEQIGALRKDVPFRIDWARKSIKGDAVAKYLVDVLYGKPVIKPWNHNELL